MTSISTSIYKSTIAKYFDYTGSFDFLDLVADAIDRLELETLDDADSDASHEELTNRIYEALDAVTMYTQDQWTIAQYYFSGPSDIIDSHVENVFDFFITDLFNLAWTILDDKKEEATNGED